MKSPKVVNAVLKKKNEKIVIEFGFDTLIYLNLESNNVNDIKIVFLEVAKELKKNNIEFLYSKDSSFESESSLYSEVAEEYINALNKELLLLQEDENLVKLRNI